MPFSIICPSRHALNVDETPEGSFVGKRLNVFGPRLLAQTDLSLDLEPLPFLSWEGAPRGRSAPGTTFGRKAVSNSAKKGDPGAAICRNIPVLCSRRQFRGTLPLV